MMRLTFEFEKKLLQGLLGRTGGGREGQLLTQPFQQRHMYLLRELYKVSIVLGITVGLAATHGADTCAFLRIGRCFGNNGLELGRSGGRWRSLLSLSSCHPIGHAAISGRHTRARISSILDATTGRVTTEVAQANAEQGGGGTDEVPINNGKFVCLQRLSKQRRPFHQVHDVIPCPDAVSLLMAHSPFRCELVGSGDGDQTGLSNP
mmetsp:Transcript_5480/g.17739  ORF Transcript_5480/g.17739 Transcript_5480/m.17739 type:complete len:206 (-) Transcript_5480:764-1381(-)